MANADDFLYEYAVVRYVPRVDREEFINIGLIMMCKRRRWLRGKIVLNGPRIEAFDPMADLFFLARQASIFERDDVPDADLPVEERYRWLIAVKSAILQVSPSHPGCLPYTMPPDLHLNDSQADHFLTKEFNRLFSMLID